MNIAQKALRRLQIKSRLEVLNQQLPELEEFQDSLNNGDSTTYTRCGRLDDVQVEIYELEKELQSLFPNQEPFIDEVTGEVIPNEHISDWIHGIPF
jgi:hypothetical protein